MRQSFKILFALILIASLAACAAPTTAPAAPPAATSAPANTAAPAAKALRVALILPGRADDQSWNQAAFAAMNWAKDNAGFPVELKVVEQVYNVADIEPALRDYAQQGYDLIIGHGFQFQEPIIKVAADFPKVHFALGTGYKLAPNVGVYDVKLEQGGYLMGLLAGMTTKSNVIGVTGGVDVSEIHRGHVAFTMAAQKANPNAKVINTFIGDFNDLTKAKEAAINQVSAGADILWQSGDGVGIAVMGACAEKNVLCMGNNFNQNGLAPKNALASVVYNWGPIYVQMMQEIQSGTFGNKQYWIDFANKGIQIVWNDAVKSQVPQAAVDALTKAQQDFVDGKLDLGDLDKVKLQ
ncbi:MAG TPA: BMP family protein [Anaerolineales bacterium]